MKFFLCIMMAILVAAMPLMAQEKKDSGKEAQKNEDPSSIDIELLKAKIIALEKAYESMSSVQKNAEKSIKAFHEDIGALKEKHESETKVREKQNKEQDEKQENALSALLKKTYEIVHENLANLRKDLEARMKLIGDEIKKVQQECQDIKKELQTPINSQKEQIEALQTAGKEIEKKLKLLEEHRLLLWYAISKDRERLNELEKAMQEREQADSVIKKELQEKTNQITSLTESLKETKEAYTKLKDLLQASIEKQNSMQEELKHQQGSIENLRANQRQQRLDHNDLSKRCDQTQKKVEHIYIFEEESHNQAKIDSLIFMMQKGSDIEKKRAIGIIAKLNRHDLLYGDFKKNDVTLEIKKEIAKNLLSLFKKAIIENNSKEIKSFISYSSSLLQKDQESSLRGDVLDCILNSLKHFDFDSESKQKQEHKETMKSVVEMMDDEQNWTKAFAIINQADNAYLLTALQSQYPSYTKNNAKEKALEIFKKFGRMSKVGSILLSLYELEKVEDLKIKILETFTSIKPSDMELVEKLIDFGKDSKKEKAAILDAIAAITDAQVKLIQYVDINKKEDKNSFSKQAEIAIEALIRIPKFSKTKLALFVNSENKDSMREILLKKENLNALTKSLEGSSLFSVGDFKEPEKFISKLRNGSDSVSLYLKGILSEQFQQQINEYNDGTKLSKELIEDLVAEFNRLLKIFFYQQEKFTSIKLSEETKSLLALKDLKNEELVRLNRLLLEDSYPQEIAKSQEKKENALEKNTLSILIDYYPELTEKTAEKRISLLLQFYELIRNGKCNEDNKKDIESILKKEENENVDTQVDSKGSCTQKAKPGKNSEVIWDIVKDIRNIMTSSGK